MTHRRIWWHIAFGILLAIASWIVWQSRFQQVPHPINGPVAFENGALPWQRNGQVSITPTGEMILKRDAGVPTALLHLGKLQDARFVQISVESRWSGVPRQEPLWASARVILMPTNREGQTIFDWNHDLFSGFGNSPWKRHEAVFELRPEWNDVRVSADLHAAAGEMALRNMQIHIVRQRTWIPMATGLLLLAWSVWLAGWLRQGFSFTAWARASACAIIILSAWWFAVWPRMKRISNPICTSYWIGQAQTVVSEPAPPPPALPPLTPAPPQQPPLPEVQTPAPPATSTTQPPSKSTSPPPDKRETAKLLDWLRSHNQRFHSMHFVGFFLFALGAFTAAGGLSSWRWICFLAIASEVIPEWNNGWQFFDRGDWIDLCADYVGIACAILAWLWLKRIARRVCWLRWLVAHPARIKS